MPQDEINSVFYAFQWITDLSVKIIFDNFTVKIIKYNFTLFNDETTVLKIFPCGTSTLFLLEILTMSGCSEKSKA
jgi:hypothetical protein